jgi:transposase
LIHGARAAAMRIKRDRFSIGAWMKALEARAPRNVLVVAMANKLARIAWAVLSSEEDYRPAVNVAA